MDPVGDIAARKPASVAADCQVRNGASGSVLGELAQNLLRVVEIHQAEDRVRPRRDDRVLCIRERRYASVRTYLSHDDRVPQEVPTDADDLVPIA